MATAAHIELSPSTAGVYHVPNIAVESCKIGSELLQKNHDKYHIFFNQSGFHNHIAHHLLTIFALGANPDQLHNAFHHNEDIQRPQLPVDQENVQSMSDRAKFKRFLGKEQYFHDYEIFFRKEIEKKGVEDVLNENLFARDDHAEQMLGRMFGGFLHPIIHLGFGIEFKQPAIIIEALAEAAVHDGWTLTFLQNAERAAKNSPSSTKSLVQLLHEARSNKTIRESPHWEDGNKVRDGVLKRATDEMISLAAQWTVTPNDLERKTAEMINAAIYFAGASQRAEKQVKFDFFYMHSVNCSIFFSAFMREPWMKVEDKCRLLEWKGRFDLAMYVSRGSPELRVEEIVGYKPKKRGQGWDEVIARVDDLPDDGHASKLVRALAHGEAACKPYEGESDDTFPVKGEMWPQLANMAIDSVEDLKDEEPRWIRNCGFDQAWEKIPAKAKL